MGWIGTIRRVVIKVWYGCTHKGLIQRNSNYPPKRTVWSEIFQNKRVPSYYLALPLCCRTPLWVRYTVACLNLLLGWLLAGKNNIDEYNCQQDQIEQMHKNVPNQGIFAEFWGDCTEGQIAALLHNVEWQILLISFEISRIKKIWWQLLHWR